MDFTQIGPALAYLNISVWSYLWIFRVASRKVTKQGRDFTSVRFGLADCGVSAVAAQRRYLVREESSLAIAPQTPKIAELPCPNARVVRVVEVPRLQNNVAPHEAFPTGHQVFVALVLMLGQEM